MSFSFQILCKFSVIPILLSVFFFQPADSLKQYPWFLGPLDKKVAENALNSFSKVCFSAFYSFLLSFPHFHFLPLLTAAVNHLVIQLGSQIVTHSLTQLLSQSTTTRKQSFVYPFWSFYKQSLSSLRLDICFSPQEGAFIVRNSSKDPNSYSMSLYFNRSVRHLRWVSTYAVVPALLCVGMIRNRQICFSYRMQGN